MSKTRRKASTPKQELPHRGNIQPARVAQADLIGDWLFEADMRHEIEHTPRQEWSDEVWRFYWKMLDDAPAITPLGECKSIDPRLLRGRQ